MFKIELGKEVKAIVTGFTGIVMSRSECLYGCNRYHIQPKVGTDGKIIDGYWFDEDDIEVVGDGVKKTIRNTGGMISRTH